MDQLGQPQRLARCAHLQRANVVLPDDYLRRCPEFHPPPLCDCPQLVAHPIDSARWPWKIRNSTELKNYVADLGQEASERLIAFYLDNCLNVLAIEMFSDDDPFNINVPIGRILTRGYLLNSKALILAHNHPSGDARPSQQDIVITRRILRAAEGMGITLLEHVICAGCEMRALGYM